MPEDAAFLWGSRSASIDSGCLADPRTNRFGLGLLSPSGLELIRFAGSQFDPLAVRAMVAVSAPRLRHAQGALAWLANIPLVTTHIGMLPADQASE